MIIIGYPGIGKSTLARKYPGGKYVDLESSHFNGLKENEDSLLEYSDPRRIKDSVWARMYCSIALDLSRQGYIVFVSAHEAVQRTFLNLITDRDHITVCYPDSSLKSDWLRRLRERYQYYSTYYTDDGKDGEKRALLRAIDYYDEDIEKLHNSSFEEVVIKSIDYDLETLLFDKEENKND